MMPLTATERAEFEAWYAGRFGSPRYPNPTLDHAAKVDALEIWTAALRAPKAVIKAAADKLDEAKRCRQSQVEALIDEALELLDGGRVPDNAAEPAPAKALAIPEDCPHIIWFDDQDQRPLVFAGHGARAAAERTFKKVSMQWNAHLFVRIDKNSRDCPYPVAAVVEVPPAVKQIPAN